ncbi:MAG: HAMP domain-containing histidine kinase [Prevotella sp.]|nr:HAMP domain-containing histidine kinase [Prevotella sp.]
MTQLISQQMLNLAFMGLQIGVGIYDMEGRLISCNEEFRKLKNMYLLDDGPLQRTMQSKKDELTLLKGSDGVVLESYVTPCVDETGEIISYLYRLSDVTSQNAPSKDKALEEVFLNNVSHEIRTPLNAIVGFCDLLNGVTGLHMEESEKLMMKEHIHQNANRLVSTVEDILDLSKMQKGCLPLHKTVVSLMEVCYKAREGAKYGLQKGVKMKHEYPTSLRDKYIYTDGKRLEQLLRNLLTNACQHTSAGSVKLKVSTFNEEDGGRKMLQIRVDDTGGGVDAEQQDMLFMPFRKIDHRSEGLGVGLAICKEIARMLNGRIYYDMAYKGGSSFVLEMPFEEI